MIDVRQAAVGLACASASISHTVIAKREVSRLFSDANVYRSLFNPNTEALRLLRSVLLTREVDSVLDRLETETTGVLAGVAVHGRRIIARLLLRQLGDGFLASPTSEIDPVIANVDDTVGTALQRLVAEFPENAYPANVFKNQARCVELLNGAGYAT